MKNDSKNTSENLRLFFRGKQFLLMVIALSLQLASASFAHAESDVCSVDLNNQKQVIQRLAELKLRTEEIAPAKSDFEFQIEHYKSQLQPFADKFGVDVKEFEKKVDKELEIIKKQRSLVKNTNEKDKKIIKENIAQELERLRIGPPIQFHKIEPGSFLMGEKKVPTTISTSFEMMDRPVTQRQWALIMGDNPSLFVDGEYTEEIFINGKFIKMQPENPVESLSGFFIKMLEIFIKKVNQLSEEDDTLVKTLIPGYQKGDILRLPTEAEWEYVSRDRGRVNSTYYHGEEESELGDYAWYDANSKTTLYPEGTTHPVAQKKPIIVHGPNGEELPFYDLQGNVMEVCQDYFLYELKGGLDPKGSSSPVGNSVIRGSSWQSKALDMRLTFRDRYLSPWNRDGAKGFRLVKTRAK